MNSFVSCVNFLPPFIVLHYRLHAFITPNKPFSSIRKTSGRDRIVEQESCVNNF